jgi:RNA polymerase sigma-70 factor (ECF subfamily)
MGVGMDWITTSTILCELRDFGNHVAWDRFVARFRAPLVSFARKSGLAQADAQDLAQDALAAFADAYRRGEYDRGKGRLSNWLFGIAYRHVLRQRRRLARDAVRIVSTPARDDRYDIPLEPQVADLWDREWEAALVRECVERARREFPATTFRAFEAVVLDQQPPRTAAEFLNLPVKTVYDAKYRVLKRVRELRAALDGAD